MMRRASSARRAEQFAALVDGHASAAAVGDDTRAFLDIVEHLRDVETPAMRTAFAADLRERLMAEAPVALADLPTVRDAKEGPARSVAPEPRRRRVIRIVAATCLVFGTAGGVAAASQSALPGDPLYGLKRAIERVQVSTAGSESGRGDVLLDQAATRLSEVEALAVSHPDELATADLMAETLDDFNSQAQDGAGSLVEAYNDSSDPTDIVRVRDFADDSANRLLDLSNVVPAPVRDDLAQAAQVLTDLDGIARDACADCSSLVPLELSSSIEDLQAVTQSVVNLLPGIDPTPGDTTEGGQTPPSGLPTVPDQTGPGGGDQTDGGDDPGGGGDPSQAPGTQNPTLPLPSGGGLPSLPLPSLPLPSLPLPSLPLPSLPLPSLPLPTILNLPQL